MIKTLSQNGRSDLALDILKNMTYLSSTPYFPQCTGGNQPRFSLGNPEGCGATAYLEGAAFAQSMISGFFGIHPGVNEIIVTPAIPQALLSTGTVSLTNLRLGQFTYTIEVNPALSFASISPTGTNLYKLTTPNNKKITLHGSTFTCIFNWM